MCCQNTKDTVQPPFCTLPMLTLYNPCTQIWHTARPTQQNTEQQRMLVRAPTKESLFLQVIKLHFAKSMNAACFVMHYLWGKFIVLLLANLQDPAFYNDSPSQHWEGVKFCHN